MILKYMILAGLTLTFMPLQAGDFWEEKDYTQWNKRQVKRILEDSPWSRVIIMNFDLSTRPFHTGAGQSGTNDGSGSSSAPHPGAGVSTSAPLSTDRSVRGEIRDAENPALHVILRWHSALPVKQAIVRLMFADEAPTSEQAAKMLAESEQHYILGIKNLPEIIYHGALDELTKNVRLKVPNKPDIPASASRYDIKNSILFMAFAKPKDGNARIQLSDREIEFEMKLGSKKLNRKFPLKDMVYKGKLEI